MKLKAPPYSDIVLRFERDEDLPVFNKHEKEAFVKAWPTSWPAYRQVLLQLFSDYKYDDLLKGKSRVAVRKLIPSKNNDGGELLLSFSFDDSGITWDIFQKGNTVVHAQPVF